MSDLIKTGIEAKVNFDTNSAEGALLAMVAELKAFRDGWEKGGAEIDKAEKGIRKVGDETHKVSVLTETWKGIWQGVGQGLFNVAMAGVHGVVSETERLIDKANEFGDVFERMAARGVEHVDDLKAATVELANALGHDLLETAKAVDLSTIFSPEGTNHIETARAALMAFELTGADYNQTIRDSAQLTKAYNDEAGGQAEIIAKVALAARSAKVESGELYQAIGKLAPQTQRLGISLDQLLEVTTAGLKKGIQPMRMGLIGMSEILDQVVKPSEDLTRVLAEQELVTTRSSSAFLNQTSAVSRLKGEFENLNRELEREKQLTQEIALDVSDAQRSIDRYTELSKKKEEGARLNRLEARELKDLGRELKSTNNDLAQYDKSARFVADSEFRRLTILDQLRQRIKNASLVQGDLEQSTKHLELESSRLTDQLQEQESQVERLATAMGTEMPAAIQRAISEGGLGAFLQRLSGSAEAMAQFSGQAQTFMQGVSGQLGSTEGAANAGANGLQRLRGELDGLVEGAYGAYEKLKARWENLETILVSPLSAARDSFSREFSALFSQERIAQVQAWAEQLGEELSGSVGELAHELVADIEAGLDGEKEWGEIVGKWLDKGWPVIADFLSDAFGAMTDIGIQSLEDKQDTIAGAIVGVMKAVMAAAYDAVVIEASHLFDPIADAWTRAMSGAPAFGGVTPGALNSNPGDAFGDFWGLNPSPGVNPSYNVQGAQGTSNSVQNSFTINGAGDPGAVADEVVRTLQRQERIGLTGSRNY